MVTVIDTANAFGFMVGSQYDLNIFVGEKYATNFMFGGWANDIFVGGDAGNMMFGGSGNNLMTGGKMGDVFLTGSGQDEVYGGGGGDIIIANADTNGWGNNFLQAWGGKGNDKIQGADGHDWLNGEDGRDAIRGGGGDDYASGGLGNDRVFGGTGDDYIAGDEGNDLLNGGSGNDRVDGGAGDDLLSGGKGADTFMFYNSDNGTDTITDFDAAIDVIIFTGEFTLKEGPGGTTVHYDAGDLFVMGVSAFELAPAIHDDWGGIKG